MISTNRRIRFSIESRSLNDFESGIGHLTVSDVSESCSLSTPPGSQEESHAVAIQLDFLTTHSTPASCRLTTIGTMVRPGLELEARLADVGGRDGILETLRLRLLDIVAAAAAVELKVGAFDVVYDREAVALAFPHLADSASFVGSTSVYNGCFSTTVSAFPVFRKGLLRILAGGEHRYRCRNNGKS